MKSVSLQVPYGFDSHGDLVSPVDAVKGQRYNCPGCGEPLLLKAGAIKRRHFAHSPADSRCSQETITHNTAKGLIQSAIHNWKAGLHGPPVIIRTCKICRNHTEQPVPDKVQLAVLEHIVSSGHVVDVALQVDNPKPKSIGHIESAADSSLTGELDDIGSTGKQRTPVNTVNDPLASCDKLVTGLAVEIRVTHPVDSEKASRLSVPFVELSGDAVIASPFKWRPLQDTLLPFLCRYCARYFTEFREEVARVSAATDVPVPGAFYRYTIAACWRCSAHILVFTWPYHKPYTQHEPPREHRPWTIQNKYSPSRGSKYWANTCPYCTVIQDDNMLFRETDGALFGMDCREDSSEAFQENMQWLALRWSDAL